MGNNTGFVDKLLDTARRHRSWLCVGLDPDPALMPQVDLFQFNKAIVDATSDLVCAYKPNLAFYEALGLDGLEALKQTVDYISARGISVIGDAKRGDVGHTARAYARALFEVFGFDAVTVNPYLGRDSLEPFLEYGDRGVFILCRTSNPGAADFQSLGCGDGSSLFLTVARKANEWNTRGNVGLVVGATYPEELKQVRGLCPDLPILIPGVGAQGGDLALALKYGSDARGEKAIVNSSRQIIYASRGDDYAAAARQAASKIRQEMSRYLPGSSHD